MQVNQLMGPAVKTEFSDTVEEWPYCRTGQQADEFVALFFHDDESFNQTNAEA